MTLRSITVALATTLFCLTTMAQSNCPRERTETVARQTILGKDLECGGISVNIGGVQLHQPNSGCPLFLIYEPEHHVARPAKQDTMVEVVQLLDVTRMRFECKSKWFLFVPYTTECRLTGTDAIAAVPLMRTVPCALGPQS